MKRSIKRSEQLPVKLILIFKYRRASVNEMLFKNLNETRVIKNVQL